MQTLKFEQLLTGDMILTQRERLCMVVYARLEGLVGEEEGRACVLISDPDRPRSLFSTLYLGRGGTVKVVSR